MCNIRILSSIVLSCWCALALAEGKDVVTVVNEEKRIERPVIVLPSKNAVDKTETEERYGARVADKKSSRTVREWRARR